MENKHKLIPNTLIISNEHLSYSISEEPMCYTARKPHDSKSEALERHGGGGCLCLLRSTEGSRVPLWRQLPRRGQPVWGAVRGSAGQWEQCGAARSVRGGRAGAGAPAAPAPPGPALPSAGRSGITAHATPRSLPSPPLQREKKLGALGSQNKSGDLSRQCILWVCLFTATLQEPHSITFYKLHEYEIDGIISIY